MVRTFGALLILSLLATLAAGAQCVVLCSHPVAPPPCHHHAPAKQTPPAQACSAAMLPGESHSFEAVQPVATFVSALPIAAPIENFLDAPVLVHEISAAGPYRILRI